MELEGMKKKWREKQNRMNRKRKSVKIKDVNKYTNTKLDRKEKVNIYKYKHTNKRWNWRE